MNVNVWKGILIEIYNPAPIVTIPVKFVQVKNTINA